ncbi:MAG TPA: LysM peptidoglycan-binding domain-containing protein [Herpetosiphonaceae bacterium]
MAPEDKEKSMAERLSESLANAAQQAKDKKESAEKEAEIERLQDKVEELERKAKEAAAAAAAPKPQAPKPNPGFQTPQNSNYEAAPAQPAPQPAAPPPAPEPRTYTVVGGDSLSKIAKRFYGDAMQWKKIYEANRDKISNPDLIHPGQVFIIP